MTNTTAALISVCSDPLLCAVIGWVRRKDGGGPQHQSGAAGRKRSPQRQAGPHGTDPIEHKILCIHAGMQNHANTNTVQDKGGPPTHALFSTKKREVKKKKNIYVQKIIPLR